MWLILNPEWLIRNAGPETRAELQPASSDPQWKLDYGETRLWAAETWFWSEEETLFWAEEETQFWAKQSWFWTKVDSEPGTRMQSFNQLRTDSTDSKQSMEERCAISGYEAQKSLFK